MKTTQSGRLKYILTFSLISLFFFIIIQNYFGNKKEIVDLNSPEIEEDFAHPYNLKTKDYNDETTQNRVTSIEEKKQAWANLIANHKYNRKASLSYEDWKAIPKADRPDLAMEQNFLMTMDPATGNIPHDRFLKANREVARMVKDRTAISGVSWVERGPDNVGGRTRALMFDPNDAANGYKKVWAGGVGGGLWYTNDITASSPTWSHVNDLWDNIAVTCIAYNPNNTQEIYVGTGEGWYNGGAQQGGGIWKTTDGGSTWSHISNTEPSTSSPGYHFQYINKIVITSSGTILVATRGYYINTGGVLRSTDGGSTWTQVCSIYQSGKNYYDRAADIEIAANGDIYTSFGIYSSAKVLKSTNDGVSWSDLSTNVVSGGITGVRRIELACAPSNSNVVYAVAQDSSPTNSSQDAKWLKKTTNGGSSWSTITTPVMVDGSGDHFTRGQAFYDLILAVHPTDANLVIAGGIDLHRSTDGGTNWTGVSHWYGGYSKPEVHADQHAIVFRPGASNEVIFGNDGGVYYSSDCGNSSATPSFGSRNSGYNTVQYYACATKNETNSNYFLAGSQDNGSHQFTQPQMNSTTEVTGGDGAFCHIDADNSDIQTTSYTNNNIYRSLDGGSNFTKIFSESSGHFINPSDYDDSRNILYLAAADNTIKRVSNFDQSSFTNSDISISVGTAQISALKVSPYNDVLFLGIENGRVYKYSNPSTASPTLTRIDNGTTPISSSGWVSSIDVGADDNHLLVTYSNYGVNSVWETTDGGTNWSNREGNLPDIPVRWGLFNPNNRDEVLLATELGVWSTDDITTTTPDWDPTNTNLANTRCDMLQYRAADKMVLVATHGRGLYTTDVFVTEKEADFAYSDSVSCTGSLTVEFTDGSLNANNSWAWDVDNDGTTDYTTQNPTHTYSSPGIYSVKLTIDNGSTSTIKRNKIIVLSSSEPTAFSGCTLPTDNNNGNGYGIGIFRFAIENIDNSTSHNDGMYQNYTCTHMTPLKPSTNYNVTIKTGAANSEGAAVFIDYNDDGDFADAGEDVLTFAANTDGERSSSFTTSSTVTFDKGLRLRVVSKYGSIPSNACDASYGQIEDYTVYFVRDAEWVGGSSTDWNTASNWSPPIVPSTTANITIASGSNNPIIDQSRAINNLDIESGGILTIPVDMCLTVNGRVANSNGNSGLVVNSTSSGTGAIISNTSGVSASIKRYANGGGSGYIHYVSSSISDATGANLTGGTLGNYKAYSYNEAGSSWNPVASGDPLTPGKGYYVAYDGNKTLSFEGTLNTGDVTVGVTRSGASATGFNLLGNPYPCRIDANDFVSDNANISGSVYFWVDDHGDASGYTTADYASWNPTGGAGSGAGAAATGGGSSTTPNRYIESGQGFFVEASSAGNVTFTNNHKVADASAGFFAGETEAVQRAWFDLTNNDINVSNNILIGFLEGATVNKDRLYDATKYQGNENLSFYSQIENESKGFVIQGLPVMENASVELGYFAKYQGNYSIELSAIENLSGKEIILEDLYEKTKIRISEEKTYTFKSMSGQINDRFVLHFNPMPDRLYDVNSNYDIYFVGNTLNINSLLKDNNGTLKIISLHGKVIISEVIQGEYKFEKDLSGFPKSTYVYYLIENEKVHSGKIIVR